MTNSQPTSDSGFTGYWLPAYIKERCSVCFSRGRVLRLMFNHDQVRVCEPCAIALRELLIDALEDVDHEQ